MIYDISPPIDEQIAVWPGDIKPQQIITYDMQNGDNITLSGIKTTVHLGAHADAPSHFNKHGKSIGECDIKPYLGACQVIKCNMNNHNQIMVDSINAPIIAPRVLFQTGTYLNHTQWQNNFAYLSVEVIKYLHKHQIQLIGIDTPSVDCFDSSDLPAHNLIAKYQIAILEGLNLNNIPEGVYELIALPLRLVGFDASPVRAILRR